MNGAAGMAGATGTNAVQGCQKMITIPPIPQPISSQPPTCINQQAATDGSAGSPAGKALPGWDGAILSNCVVHLGDVRGLVQVALSGGTGGNGGSGANGGNGGNGGNGAAAMPNSRCGALAGGNGGNGGNGSDGMSGGKGADGPQVVLYYTTMAPGTTFSLANPVLSGGLGGSPGGGGQGGGGGGGGGTAGQPGSAGQPGPPGASGAPANLIVRSEGQ
ncbi:hypothetical protein CSZ94_12050 [Janthinobacterium sp. ROICE36]|nr:hypothetical protein CSZ94_12050 [Janthinobacterium sp. ROICE36]